MKHSVILLACLLLPACGGFGKPRPEAALYDFGLTQAPPAAAWPARLGMADVEAPSGLDTTAIRYRLEYSEPARVYAYTLSQWSAMPAEMLTLRLRQSVGEQAGGATCSLQVTLEAFDHVFDTAGSSHGMVRLHAVLTDHRHHALLAQTSVSHSQPASTQDAKGGVAAISQAADGALQEVVAWVTTTSADGKLRACFD